MDADKFHTAIADEIRDWVIAGLEETREVLLEPDTERDPVQEHIKDILVDGTQVVVVDKADNLHVFRIHVERL